MNESEGEVRDLSILRRLLFFFWFRSKYLSDGGMERSIKTNYLHPYYIK